MQSFHGILVCRREPVLRREAVLDRDDDRLCVGGKPRAEVVGEAGIGVEENEAPAVVIYDNGELLGVERIRKGEFGEVDSDEGIVS